MAVRSNNKTQLNKNQALSIQSQNRFGNVQNKLPSYDDTNSVFLGIVVDDNGKSVINLEDFDESTADLICSKYGATPLTSYQTKSDFKKPFNRLIVVCKHNQNLYDVAADNAMRMSNRFASQIALDYENDLERIYLTKKKNLLIAKVDSLRLLNKAVALEKSHNENNYENERYQQAILEIRKMHHALHQKNDLELNENIARLEHNQALDIDELNAKRSHKFAKLDAKYEIALAKRAYEYERIETLARGEEFEKYSRKEKVDNIKKRHQDIATNEPLFEEPIESIASVLSKINYYDLDAQEREIVDKFFDALDEDISFEERTRVIESYHNDILEKDAELANYNANIDNLKGRRAYIMSNQQYHKIIGANKKSFTIVEDAMKFATEFKTLYETYNEIDEHYKGKKKSKKENDLIVVKDKSTSRSARDELTFEGNKSTDAKKADKEKKRLAKQQEEELEQQMLNERKQKRLAKKQAKKESKKELLEQQQLLNQEVELDNVDKKADKKVKHDLKVAKKQSREFKDVNDYDINNDQVREWREENSLYANNDYYAQMRAFYKQQAQMHYEQQKQEYKRLKELNRLYKMDAKQKRHNEEQDVLVKQEDNATLRESFNDYWDRKTNYISPKRIQKIRENFEYVVTDDLTRKHINVFFENGIDIHAIWREFDSIDPNHFPNSPENKELIKDYIEKAILIFRSLEQNEIKRQQRIELSRKLNDKFNVKVEKVETKFALKAAKIQTKYNAREEKITHRYALGEDHVRNQHFINRESIIEHEISCLSKEEENHLNNLSWYHNNLKKYHRTNYEFEKSEIVRTVNEINKFNNKNPENQISLNDIPALIDPSVINKNIVSIALNNNNGRIEATTHLAKNKITVNALNKKMPSNVTKIYVLDKFRNVADPMVKGALLRELAELNYNNDLKYIDLIEKRQIQAAQEKMAFNLRKVEQMRQDAAFIRRQSLIMDADSHKMSILQNEELRLKDENWKVSDYEAKLLNKQLERELKLQDKINKLENR